MISLPKTYYISQGTNLAEHISNIEKVCQAGCQIIQLRLKNVIEDEYISTAKKAKEICRTYNTTFIINDNLNCAIAVDADGIHVGKEDVSIHEIKAIFKDKIIGGTANTLEDCLNHINNGVDYIGLGPFTFTNTKSNLSPVLGLKGYEEIISELKERELTIPIVAIGGIKEENTKLLFNIGVSSIAVSGLLTGKTEEEIKHIITNIQ